MSGSTPVSNSIEAIPAGQTAQPALMPSVSQSPAARAWRRFRRNRLGFISLVIFCAVVVLSLFAEVLSTDKPFVARVEQQNVRLGMKAIRERSAVLKELLDTGAIGLTGGGVAYMVGNALAGKILGGVVVGLALALMGPSIVA